MTDENYIVGIRIDGQLRPLFDRLERMVLVSLDNFQNIPMLEYLAEEHRFILPNQRRYRNLAGLRSPRKERNA